MLLQLEHCSSVVSVVAIRLHPFVDVDKVVAANHHLAINARPLGLGRDVLIGSAALELGQHGGYGADTAAAVPVQAVKLQLQRRKVKTRLGAQHARHSNNGCEARVHAASLARARKPEDAAAAVTRLSDQLLEAGKAALRQVVEERPGEIQSGDDILALWERERWGGGVAVIVESPQVNLIARELEPRVKLVDGRVMPADGPDLTGMEQRDSLRQRRLQRRGRSDDVVVEIAVVYDRFHAAKACRTQFHVPASAVYEGFRETRVVGTQPPAWQDAHDKVDPFGFCGQIHALTVGGLEDGQDGGRGSARTRADLQHPHAGFPVSHEVEERRVLRVLHEVVELVEDVVLEEDCQLVRGAAEDGLAAAGNAVDGRRRRVRLRLQEP
ncbi:hypothetical protein ColLi_11462 [Colletotrichum liriopes]|uniref:Uncharacterized protein n=1 Tax=Colletotrichum liriopes TaxID=708192 RepID=A0AA37GWI7_9PEZI|nr:hypothetical protein ColLi_11462 [Colletotrichum liriopes]